MSKFKSDYIESTPDVLSGQLVFKGSRLSVDLILRYLAKGWSVKKLRENYSTFDELMNNIKNNED